MLLGMLSVRPTSTDYRRHDVYVMWWSITLLGGRKLYRIRRVACLKLTPYVNNAITSMFRKT